MRFDVAVPPGGYRWWYLDATSDDESEALTVIVFLGSVFSPWYFRARRRQAEADPLDHAAFNVALYRPRGSRWTFTERGRAAVARSADRLCIGPSRIAWTEEGALVLDLAERGCPWPGRVAGRIRVEPAAVSRVEYALDAAGRHRWQPIAPCARVEVELERPRLRWRGTAYVDSNHGPRPLEHDFLGWDWSRNALPGGRTRIFYDVRPRTGPEEVVHALCFGPGGEVERVEPPPRSGLAPTAWRVRRGVRSAGPGEVIRTLEDTPFYARSLIRTTIDGRSALGVHESLDLGRFAHPCVQLMLPFRAPRRSGGSVNLD